LKFEKFSYPVSHYQWGLLFRLNQTIKGRLYAIEKTVSLLETFFKDNHFGTIIYTIIYLGGCNSLSGKTPNDASCRDAGIKPIDTDFESVPAENLLFRRGCNILLGDY
jgi:hypothetical protein